MRPGGKLDKVAQTADCLDEALEALWRGDSTPLGRLLDSDDDASGPRPGELLKGAIDRQTAAAVPDVAGHEIIEKIDEGGMGKVFKALQLNTKRIVALKVMRAGAFASEPARQRFQREVELTARFQHSGIVRVFEAGETSTGQPYYTMDYVQGVPLGRWFSSSTVDVRTMLLLFQELCLAVEYAHQHGVIHRDLKPGNVLIDDEGQPHILDFGLAKAIDLASAEESADDTISMPGEILGTLPYLAPEQAAGQPGEIDARTDLWALGVMLFEALTGSLPFDHTGSRSAVARRIVEEQPACPSSLSGQIDGELDLIVLKALDKDKALRYQSAKALGDDIGRYLRGETIFPKRVDKTYRLRNALRKHRVGVALGLSLAVVVMAGIWASVHWRKRQALQLAYQVLGLQRDLEAGNLEDALGATHAFLGRHSDLPEAFLLFAQTRFRSGWNKRDANLIADAIQTLEDRLVLDPTQWSCAFLLAEIRQRRNDPGWERLRTRAERQFPGTAEAWYQRSFATLDFDEAIRCVENALARNPRCVMALRRLVHLYTQTEAFDEAVRVARVLSDIEDTRRSYWVMYQGHARMKQGRYPEAIRLYTLAADLAPSWHQPHRHHALGHLCTCEYGLAIDDYAAAIEKLGAGSASWERCHRATPLWIVGRREEAAAEYRKSLSLRENSYANARLFLVLRDRERVLRESGDVDEARRVYEEAGEVLERSLYSVVAEGWTWNILACLADRFLPEELLDKADPTNAEQVCEALYYAGEACLLRSRIDEAQAWFQACVDTNLILDPDVWPPDPMSEYHLAKWRLTFLSPAEPTTSPARPHQS